jgi:hypothetical protein
MMRGAQWAWIAGQLIGVLLAPVLRSLPLWSAFVLGIGVSLIGLFIIALLHQVGRQR